jgi:asparagine synthase (glutamine-hydrolysing)
MCGILGQIKLHKDIKRDVDRFNYSLDLLTHRGPDARGMSLGDNYIFGHRRLSIIDLSENAAQPMYTMDKSVVIIFNGEIYNYQELKKILEHKGYIFNTTSDTEVLLNGYHHYGIEFIHRLNGMFAFSLYDNRSKSAYVVRDRIGIKPLYFTTINGRLTFSSEVKAILAYEDIQKRLNLDAISSYLSFRYPVLNDTFFEDINVLPPGHYIKVSMDGYKQVQYWDPVHKYEDQMNDRGEQYYLDHLRELLESSVKYRMVSDVPIGSILSGGVDSAIITALMSKLSYSRPSTFTIGYDEVGYNEYHYADIIVEKYSTCHHEMHTTGKNYFSNLERIISFKDAPLSIPNEVTQYEMCLKLKKDVSVILSGSGADELFLGYGRIFRSVWDFKRYKSLGGYGNEIDRALFLRNYDDKYGERKHHNEIDHFMDIYSYTSDRVKQSLLNHQYPHAETTKNIRKKFREYFDKITTNKYLDKMSYMFLKVHQPGILQHNDITSMAASVELRVPFLDHRLVEYAMTIPEKYKLKWKSSQHKSESMNMMSHIISEDYDIPKYILKKSYESEIPNEVLYRKKVGFPVPLHLWIGDSFQKDAQELLLDTKARKRGIYNDVYIEKWFKENKLSEHQGDPRTYQNSMAAKFWMLMNLELFLNKHFN